MEQQSVTPEGVDLVTEAENAVTLKPYEAPRLELLDIEATKNGPGFMPDSGGIDFS
jgi:hypothetical protein